jgi:hypothetical protein
MALYITREIIAVYFQTHINVYQSTCMRQKATAVYRDVGLQHVMSVMSPSVAWNSEVAPNFFGNLVDL